MPQSLEARLPPMQLTDGYKIVFEARDASGLAVANVKIATPLVFAEIEGDITIEQATGPLLFMAGVPEPTG